MVMKSILFYSLVLIGLIGCGGGGGGSGAGGPGGGTSGVVTVAPSDINLTKEIHDGNVPNYDSMDPIENQYQAVINYLRSLAIECNDSEAIVGPSDALVWNDSLENAAKEHSDDMNTSGHYGHDGSGTVSDITGQTLGHASNPGERVDEAGYAGYTGENIARLQSYYETAGGKPAGFVPVNNDTWIAVMAGWINSTHGHCSNIMNPVAKSFGMSEVGSRVDTNATDTIYSTFWTQEFGDQ
jgi:uncharacterized protein YkwD